MAQLQWNQAGTKTYEHGIKNGVLYPQNEDTGAYEAGIAWSGLSSVGEKPEGGDVNDVHADNVKWLSLSSAEKLNLGVEAYAYPPEFAECDGTRSLGNLPGVKVYQQARKPFGFCYSTIKGNDTKGDAYGELIHLAYGCKASPSERNYQTISDGATEPISFNWDFSTSPVEVPGMNPSSLIVIDTSILGPTKTKKLKDKLYGTNDTEPTLPTPTELAELLKG